MNVNNRLHAGQAGLQAIYRNLSYSVDIYSLPLAVASIGWNKTDSLAFARTSVGYGDLTLANIKWKSKSDLSIIPKIEGSWENTLNYKSVYLGSKFGNNSITAGSSLLQTNPKTEKRYGHIFTDSTSITEFDTRYAYNGSFNNFSLQYLYAGMEFTALGLLREETPDGDNEKRFLFLPTEGYLHLAKMDYSHLRQSKDRFKARALFGYAKLELLRDKRRFHETLAPNRALTASAIKTLSMSVYTRNFRAFGEASAQMATLGPGYDWNVPIGNWTLTPGVLVDFAYLHGKAELTKRTETSVLLGVHKGKADSSSWEISVLGALASAEIALNAPKQGFFAKFGTKQAIPFYFHNKNYPEDNIIVPPASEDIPPPEQSSPENDKFKIKSPLDLVRNGFATTLELGIRF